jgi:hypothetical protein
MIERTVLPCAKSDSWFSEFTSLFVYNYCSHFSRNYSRFWMCRLLASGEQRLSKLVASLYLGRGTGEAS